MIFGAYVFLALGLTIVGMFLSAIGLFNSFAKHNQKKGTPLFALGFLSFFIGMAMLLFNVLAL